LEPSSKPGSYIRQRVVQHEKLHVPQVLAKAASVLIELTVSMGTTTLALEGFLVDDFSAVLPLCYVPTGEYIDL